MPRILVVDDNAMMRTVMRAALDRAGHKVTLADSGEKALKAVEGGEAFDLVVTDIHMPKMSGADLTRALRKTLPDLNVLLISGDADAINPKEFGQAVFSLEKPFTADKLASKVAEILG